MATQTKPEARRPTNVSLDARAVAEAKIFGINVSAACERGLLAAIKAERERRWIEENTLAIAATNRWVEENGIPFAKHRAFHAAI